MESEEFKAIQAKAPATARLHRVVFYYLIYLHTISLSNNPF